MPDLRVSLKRFATAWLDHRRHQARVLRTDLAGLDVVEHLMAGGPSSPSDLARAMGVSSADMAITLGRLESAGHILREGVREDGRRVRVGLTPDFLRRTAPTARAMHSSMDETLGALSPQDTVLLADALTALAGNLESSPEPPGTRHR